MATGTFLAVDATNLLYRSFHALAASRLTHAGRPVWAVHGLLLQLAKVVEAVRPSHLLLAFDTPEGCPPRREMYPDYKASRAAPALELAQQLAWAPSAVRHGGLRAQDDPHWEADDILASAVAGARANGLRSVVVTSDRDAYQLLADDVDVLTPDGRTVSVETLQRDFGVSPQGYAVLAALRGEPSDNLRGVTGVGEKTAARLAGVYGSLDRIDAASDEELRDHLGPKTLRSLRNDLPHARRSWEVARLRNHLTVDVPAAAIELLDPARVASALAEVGLGSAGARVASAIASTGKR